MSTKAQAPKKSTKVTQTKKSSKPEQTTIPKQQQHKDNVLAEMKKAPKSKEHKVQDLSSVIGITNAQTNVALSALIDAGKVTRRTLSREETDSVSGKLPHVYKLA